MRTLAFMSAGFYVFLNFPIMLLFVETINSGSLDASVVYDSLAGIEVYFQAKTKFKVASSLFLIKNKLIEGYPWRQ